MAIFLNDLRYALRRLRKSPGFAWTAIVMLALGIGANTAIFSVVNALMLRPLPYPEPSRLGTLITDWRGTKGWGDSISADNQTFEQVRQQVPAVTAAAYGMESGVNLQAGSSVQYVQQLRVSSKYFEVLGIPPRMGRGFTPEEDRPNGPAVAVLSNALWHSVFHADPHMIGRAISLKGQPYTVVGVLPGEGQSPLDGETTRRVDIWTPLQPSNHGEGANTNYGVLLRLRSGSTWAQADAQLSRVRPDHLVRQATANAGASFHLESVPLQQSQTGSVRPSVLGLMIAVGFILLIACANLAGLALVRAQQRSGEMATRMALGASPFALVRQLWTENILLALIGGTAGLGVARGGLILLQRLIPSGLLPTSNFALDDRVLLFTLAVSLIASVLFGMLPALELRRIDLRSSMASSGNGMVSSSGMRKVRPLLIAGEIALTMVLVSASGVLIRSLIYLETLPPGFDATNVMTGKVSLDEARYHNPAAFQYLLTASLDAMRRIPGVENAAVGLSLPYERGLNDSIQIVDGKNAGKRLIASVIYVTPGYFQTLRMRLLAGRDLSAGDTAQTQPVAIVNESYARQYLAQRDPVGLHLGTGGEIAKETAIVGVVANVVKTPGFNGDAPLVSEPTLYLPATQVKQGLVNMAHVWFQPSWIVRTHGPVAGLTAAMQRALAEADPALPFAGFYGMEEMEQYALAMQRIEATLLSVLAGLALLLSAIGVYGLIANLVVQRTREIGIRLALGSSMQRAVIEIGRSGVWATLLGLTLGLGASFLALRTLRNLIFGIHSIDPVTLAGTALILGAVGMTATFLPTLRIARIDPARTLREE